MNSLYQKTTESVKWSALTIVFPRVISPLLMVVLARILAPECFGLLSTALIVINFSQMFWEAGLSKALIQSKESASSVANVVFWSNISLGLVTYTIIYFSAPQLSIYFNNPQTTSVLRVLCLQIILMSITTVQEALFTKDLNFKPIFWGKSIGSIASGILSIILALLGYNVWALIFGTLFGALLNLIILWYKSDWRPRMQIEWSIAPKLYRFGFWLILLGLIAWLINWFDSLLVGKYLGMSDLGIYRTGVTIVSMLFSLTIGPILAVILSPFSQIQNEKKKFVEYFYDVNKIIIFLVFPMGIILALVSADLIPVIFGDKWKGLEKIIAILSLSEGLSYCVGINPTIYQAIGKPDLQTKLSLFLLPLFVITYLIIVPLGIKPLIYAKLGLTLITLPINMIPLVRVLKISPFYILQQGKLIFLSTIVLICSILLFRWSFSHSENHLFLLCGSIFIGVISYLGVLWLTDRHFLLHVRQIVKSMI